MLFYLLCYTFLNMGAFGVVSVLERLDNSGSNYSDFRGLWYRRPVLAGLLAFFMLGLAGFPPMAGFAAKYYMFYAALAGGHPELLIIGVLASVLGMYYYLRFIAVMFMEKEPAAAPSALVTPAPLAGGQASGKLSNRTPATSGTATAVAVKPAAAAIATGSLKRSVTVANDSDISQNTQIGWMSWIGLAIAVAGTLLMGTVLPFWLVQLAQQAAQLMGAR